jgi:hypothetical protein
MGDWAIRNTWKETTPITTSTLSTNCTRELPQLDRVGNPLADSGANLCTTSKWRGEPRSEWELIILGKSYRWKVEAWYMNTEGECVHVGGGARAFLPLITRLEGWLDWDVVSLVLHPGYEAGHWVEEVESLFIGRVGRRRPVKGWGLSMWSNKSRRKNWIVWWTKKEERLHVSHFLL